METAVILLYFKYHLVFNQFVGDTCYLGAIGSNRDYRYIPSLFAKKTCEPETSTQMFLATQYIHDTTSET